MSLFLFPRTLSHKQQAAKDDAVPSTTGVPCASVIITACLTESAAKTLNLNAPQVRLFPPDIRIATSTTRNRYSVELSLQTLISKQQQMSKTDFLQPLQHFISLL